MHEEGLLAMAWSMEYESRALISRFDSTIKLLRYLCSIVSTVDVWLILKRKPHI